MTDTTHIPWDITLTYHILGPLTKQADANEVSLMLKN